ncbi:DUF4179 domain-containing protein [Paenibacillus sp. P32E]|uniref:DUF4179 domain-containing protein n=1 Tax=Paenibacillus sp. P32E TaxID=1349434 RepID=UPI00095B4246|nr:DUF4179 domain-containing protein [Paenibacillus sp. P32E]OKP87231.1 hypothetical protein A3848_19915 [Paenibacillus sp. P32E]
MENRSRIGDDKLKHLGRMIRDTPADVDLVDRTMQRYAARNRTDQTAPAVKNGRTRRGRTAVGVAAVLLLCGSFIGMAFIPPTLAASIRQIPVLNSIFKLAGDLGLRTADDQGLVFTPNRSDTHDGLTLNVPEVLFDGVRVSIGLERQTTEERFLKRELGDLMSDIKLSINGEDLLAYGLQGGGSAPGIFSLKGKDEGSRIIQFSDIRGRGGRSLPDQFELLLSVTVDGVSEPYRITLPVEKKTVNNQIADPIVRQHDGMIFTLDKVELTPITSLITTRIEVPERQKIRGKLPLMGFEMVDDSGNLVKAVNGSMGFNATDGNVLTTDTMLEPLKQPSQYITIRTYKILSIDPKGNMDKEYIPEFEVTVPLK